MPQIFHPSVNTLSRFSIVGTAVLIVLAFWLAAVVARSHYVTQVSVVRNQPIEFSHQHHVAGLGIDCRYCHTSVEDSAFAGIPPTQTCMQCHSQIWADSPKLAPVRESFRTGKPIAWTRVHDLPDFAYFDHSIHVQKGIGCTTCHGRVDTMPLMWRTQTLYMEWCLECHRNPEASIRPRDAIFQMDYRPESLSAADRAQLARQYHLSVVTDCSVCHR